MTAAPPSSATGFQNIVLVCEGTAELGDTLDNAVALAQSHDARLTILAVADRAGDVEQLARFTRTAADEIANTIAEELRAPIMDMIGDRTTDIEVRVRLGRPFREIIDDVIADGRDLVIKAAETFDGVRSYLFTSTDQHLLRKCPCPVWLVMPDAEQPPRTVLAAIDLDEEEDPDVQAGLNRNIIDAAVAIARHNGATVQLTHVWEAPAEDMIRRWTDSDDEAFRYTQSVEGRRKQALDRLANDATVAGGPRLVSHLLRGAPRTLIPDHAKAIGADLLVIGTLARTGVPGLIIGNTAEDVLNAVECSVLTVKPPGYVSPLQPQPH